MARTCERFWQAVAQQERALDRLATALRYVRACLNSVILDTLRAYAYATAIPLPGPAGAGMENPRRLNESSCEEQRGEQEWCILF